MTDQELIQALRQELSDARIALDLVSGSLVDTGDIVVPDDDEKLYGNAVRQITQQRDDARLEIDRLRDQNNAMAAAMKGRRVMFELYVSGDGCLRAACIVSPDTPDEDAARSVLALLVPSLAKVTGSKIGDIKVNSPSAAGSSRARIFAAIAGERARQDEKWGPVVRHPNVDPVLAQVGSDHQQICGDLEIPTADRAKFLCEEARAADRLSFAAFTLEEFCEAIEVHDDEERLREELVQVAACVVKWLEALDLPQPTTTTET